MFNNFVKRKNIDKEKKYSIQEILELTKGEYKHDEFKMFFNNQ